MTHRINGDTANIEKRMMELLEQESTQPLKWWYLSFAGPEGSRGVVLVEARGFASAVMYCNQLRINPGGEVMGVEIPPEKIPDERFTYRLLNRAEVEECWGERTYTLKEMEDEKERPH